MKKTVFKISKLTLSLLVLFSAMAFQVNVQGIVKAAEKDYEIYPTPHSITYQSGEYIMRAQVNVVYDETIDEPTKKRLTEILATKNKEITVSNAKDDSKTNIFVGTYNAKGDAFAYANENYALNESLFDEIDGHQVISNNGDIVVIGKDTDAAFYGLTSLKHIFNQIDGSTLRNFTIEDHADTPIRGFIEGYYGLPWSNEDRMSLMKLGGDFKMTGYIFAPKNDEYHTTKWREPYPEKELEELKKMVQVGIDTKTRFVWTAHPFMGGFNANDKENEIQLLLAKFDHLYEAGVRQFGVLGDDVGELDLNVINEMMTAVSEWAIEKGDVYDTVFCPEGYNHSWQGDYSELNTYDQGFPDNIQIFWTGEAVCQPVEQKTLDHFRRYNLAEGMDQRRSPLFWLNWPVNDINGERLMMGKGSLLRTDINVEDINGLVTNPMQEAEASKVAIFAVADYSWNVKAFNADKSWADSFKYIDPDAGDSLHVLAKHMSNPQPNNHGLVLAESEELSPLLDAFKTSLANKESIIDQGKQLIKEMDIIINAAQDFLATTKNEKLKEELTTFSNSIRDLATANKYFIETAIALENDEKTAAFNAYTEATAAFTGSKNHIRHGINGATWSVSPGSTHLKPFAETLEKAFSKEISDIATGNVSRLKITASSSFESFHEGKIENIMDGDPKTHAWFGGYEAVGQYFQLDLSVPTTVHGINILNGWSGKPEDTFGKAKLVYSTDDAQTWKDVSDEVYGDYAVNVNVSNIRLENVTNIRYECVEAGAGRKWPSMREFSIETDVSQGPKFTSEVIRKSSTEGWSVYSGAESNLIDGDDNTSVHYRVRQGAEFEPNRDSMVEGDYIGVKLSQPITLGKIHIVQTPSGNDYMKNADLEYSTDGTNWTNVQTYNNARTIDTDLSSQDIVAQYVRLKLNVTQANWLNINEFKVESKVFYNSTAYTNNDEYKAVKALVISNTGTMEAIDDVTLKPNEYIGLKMNRIHLLKELATNVNSEQLTLQVSKNGYEWENTSVSDISKKQGRYIRFINLSSTNVTFDIEEFKVETDEYAKKSLASTSGFSIYGGANTATNVLDNNRTTQTVYNGPQTEGSNFVYDLGQTIDLKKFKAVVGDGEHDYPRHGKFSVSTDGDNWTEILTLGNQDSANPGEADNTDNINYVFPVHEISYNTKEATNLNVKARYLKFEITRTKVGSNKWVRFQEFEINDGEYISEDNDPTFISTSKETENSLLKYLADGDLSTMFAPKETEGTLTYQVSEKNNLVNTVKIIQNSKVISNATVKARVLTNTDTGTSSEITLGKLSQTINEFVLPTDTTLLDVIVEWSDTNIGITELMVFKADQVEVDKTAIKAKLDNQEDTSLWTTDSKEAYTNAIETAQSVYDAQASSQSSVNSALEMIDSAIENKALKGNIAELVAAFDKVVTDADSYTVKSWREYQKVVDITRKMVEDKDNYTQAQMDAQLSNLQSAQSNLVYNPTNSELATLLLEEVDAFIATTTKPQDFYTVVSYQTFIDARDALSQLVENHKVTPQSPVAFKEASSLVESTKADLVSILNIPALIAEFDAVDGNLYTPTSYQAYVDAINLVKGYLNNGTTTEIDAGIKAVQSAKDGLILISDLDVIYAYLAQLEKLPAENYTETSYEALMDKVKEIKGNLAEATAEEIVAYQEQLQKAEADLVNVSSLKGKVAYAKTFVEEKYTTSSYASLATAIKNAEKAFVDGTKEQVLETEKEIDASIAKLVFRVNEKEAEAYINSLTKVNGTAYTDESYAQYVAAFDCLIGMLDRLADVSAEEFANAKDALENAFNNLKLKEDNSVTTGDKTNVSALLGVGALALVAFAGVIYRKKKRN